LKDKALNLTEISTTPERALSRTYLHRDYLSHSIRYSYALKLIKRGMSIADIGCGRNYILKAVYSNKLKPEIFLAVDARRGPVEFARNFKTNFPVKGIVMDIRKVSYPTSYDNVFDVVTCFEVVEHFEAKYLPHVLSEIYRILKPGGVLLLSTPNFNGKAASNHIHEYISDELNSYLIEYFTVERKHGTYASQRDIEPVLTRSEREVYTKLKNWFNTDILSLIFASLHPDQSRNILWVCRKGKGTFIRSR